MAQKGTYLDGSPIGGNHQMRLTYLRRINQGTCFEMLWHGSWLFNEGLIEFDGTVTTIDGRVSAKSCKMSL